MLYFSQGEATYVKDIELVMCDSVDTGVISLMRFLLHSTAVLGHLSDWFTTPTLINDTR